MHDRMLKSTSNGKGDTLKKKAMGLRKDEGGV